MLLLEKLQETQVALIDDMPADALPIQSAFEEKLIKTEFFEITLENAQAPPHPIESIELVFLDLHYDPNIGLPFDPYRCAQSIKSIVPEGKRYILVVWSRDTNKAQEVIELLDDLNLTPSQVHLKSKEQFSLAGGAYDVERLLAELNFDIGAPSTTESFYGQIIEIRKQSVLIDCLVDENEKKFQRRRFDLEPLDGAVTLEEGGFIFIRIITKPGSKTFEFSNTKSEKLATLFTKEGLFDESDENIFKSE
ncbi:hypothetical protein [Hymenobacter edaphi]|uniref:Uncharacterized protein n=1 Tax=Hymenobacter edaphi TaxID=2211146 RepID=A0A328B698_9BACT|nr:hypothetical protein [Hymenobacter edaphi]RAK62417.1 hypothetical protein DLM85_23735 [Hymenobacter edaphi]